MNVIRIAGFALITCAVSVTVKQLRPEFGIYIPVTAAAVILIYAVSELCGIVQTLGDRLSRYGLDTGYMSILFKCIGIAYVTRLASDVCRDAGESAIAQKAELCGKVMLMTLCIPVILDVLDMIDEVLALL